MSTPLTPAARTERARRMLLTLEFQVAAHVPAAVGAWPRAYELVAPAEVELLEALVWWEATGEEEAKERVREKHLELLHAWLAAVEEFRELGAGR